MHSFSILSVSLHISSSAIILCSFALAFLSGSQIPQTSPPSLMRLFQSRSRSIWHVLRPTYSNSRFQKRLRRNMDRHNPEIPKWQSFCDLVSSCKYVLPQISACQARLSYPIVPDSISVRDLDMVSYLLKIGFASAKVCLAVCHYRADRSVGCFQTSADVTAESAHF